MDRIPTPKDLFGAANASQSLAYASGLAGVIAGGVLYTQGETAFAVAIWILTFATGAILMIAAFLARGMAALLGRVARMEADLSTLVGRQGPLDGTPDGPWDRH